MAHDNQPRVLVLLRATGIVIAIGVVVFLYFEFAGSSNSCSTKFKVSAPAEMTKISASRGVTFSGTACAGEQIWILDFDPTDGPQGHYYQTNEQPLQISRADTWTFHNAPIGNDGDKPGTVYPIVVLRGSSACSEALRGMKPDSGGTVRFSPLPSACPQPDDTENHRIVNLVNGP